MVLTSHYFNSLTFQLITLDISKESTKSDNDMVTDCGILGGKHNPFSRTSLNATFQEAFLHMQTYSRRCDLSLFFCPPEHFISTFFFLAFIYFTLYYSDLWLLLVSLRPLAYCEPCEDKEPGLVRFCSTCQHVLSVL